MPEPKRYTVAEAARISAIVTRMTVHAARHGGRVDHRAAAALERVQARAVEREAREDALREQKARRG